MLTIRGRLITPFVLGSMSVGLNILIRHSFMDLWFWITALVPWPQLLLLDFDQLPLITWFLQNILSSTLWCKNSMFTSENYKYWFDCAFTSPSWYNCVVFYIKKEIILLYTDAMFCPIVPRFGRQYRTVCLRLGKRMCTKRDVPIQTSWRARKHPRWDDSLPVFFRGFPGRCPFQRRGPFGDMEAGFEGMRRMMTPRFFDHYYVRPRLRRNGGPVRSWTGIHKDLYIFFNFFCLYHAELLVLCLHVCSVTPHFVNPMQRLSAYYITHVTRAQGKYLQ